MATSGSWNISWQSGYWSQTYNTKYYHWSGNWSKSGTTITLSNMSLYMSFTYASGGYGVTDSVTVTGGSAQTVSYPDFNNAYNTGSVSLSNTSFSVNSSDTSKTISCAIVGETTGSTTISFDPTGTAPSGLTISTPSGINPHGATFSVALESYGDPASTSGRYIAAGIMTQNSWTSPIRSAKSSNTASATISVDNNSSQSTSLTIQPNTRYYYGAKASNTVLNTVQMGGRFVTTAEAPTLSVVGVDDDSATIHYSVPADGGYYSRSLAYNLNGGAGWSHITTIASSAAASGDFVISNLQPNTTYTLQSRASTTAGNTLGATISFITKSGITTGLYGSANSKATRINELYGSVNSDSKKIVKLYGSGNGEAKLIYQGFGHAN